MGSFAPLERITEEQNVTDNNMAIVTSRITFREGGLNEAYRGNYSCQVVVDGDFSFTSPTRPLVLVEEIVYVQEFLGCTTVQTEDPSGIICARDIVNPATTEPVTTASSFPSVFPSSGSINQPTAGGGSSLQVWVYVLVAIAAMFGMIIVVLTIILCVGFCLKKNKTTDSFKCESLIMLCTNI